MHLRYLFFLPGDEAATFVTEDPLRARELAGRLYWQSGSRVHMAVHNMDQEGWPVVDYLNAEQVRDWHRGKRKLEVP